MSKSPKKCMPPVPNLVAEPVGSFTVGTVVKYNSLFYTIGDLAGTSLTLYGFDALGNPLPDVVVQVNQVQRYKVV